MVEPVAAPDPTTPTDPLELLRSRGYLVLLVFGALIGIPVAAVAFGFLKLVEEAQTWLYQTLPSDLGFDTVPTWWPIPVLALAGLLVAAAIQLLPGTAGHEPTAGLSATGTPAPDALPGIALAAFVTLAFGGVLGPEAPLIALGGGLAALAVHLAKKDAPAQATVVIGAAGSFAAIATLLGSPLLGAFLLMEVAGLAGPLIGVVLVPGLLAAGVGSLVFIGLDDLTGWGTFSLAIPDIPAFTGIDGYQFLWAIAIGVLGAALGTAIRLGASALQPLVAGRRLLLTPLAGIAIALSAVVFHLLTDRGVDQVLFDGENALAPLIQQADTWTVGALVALVACKSVAYALSLSSLRGGPTFPAMFIGAAGGIALSHLPGLPPIAGVAMGIGAMAVTMLRLPLTSVLLTTLFLQADGVTLMPLVIVSVVVAYVASVRLTPPEPAVTHNG
ncbi:MAG: chloride channel protein [Acidimicrobiales bacterium]|jgi:H+/Cl- antiporter ClcA|nr:chloride channel protein [Acidimicrobiales bacterium]